MYTIIAREPGSRKNIRQVAGTPALLDLWLATFTRNLWLIVGVEGL